MTSLLYDVTGNDETKQNFLKSICNIKDFLEKTLTFLNSDLDDSLAPREKLDNLLSAGSRRKYHTRTFQDFYILWSILNDMDMGSLKNPHVYEQVVTIFKFMKNVPEEMLKDNKGYKYFGSLFFDISPKFKI